MITSVSSTKISNSSFRVTWTTNEPSTSTVRVVGLTTVTNSSMVTSHTITVTGARNNTRYTYYVSSTDAAGNSTGEVGPFTHQN